MAAHGDKEGPAMLMDLDVLTCSRCIDPLTVPIYQCRNGHMQCPKCNERNSQACYTCSKPVSYRNRGMEDVLGKLQFPCPNAHIGCQEYVSYDDSLDERSPHLQQCKFTCLCLFLTCDFSGSYKDLYEHMISKHLEELSSFKSGKKISLPTGRDERMVLRERSSGGGELVVVDCSFSESGEYVAVRCIAPNVPGKGNFSYRLTLRSSSNGILVKGGDIKVVDKMDSEQPEVDFLLASPDFDITKITLSIIRKAPENRGASTSSARCPQKIVLLNTGDI